LEIVKINKAISTLEERITAGIASINGAAIQQTIVVRTSAVGQTESTIGTAGSDKSINGVNVVNVVMCLLAVTVSMYLTNQTNLVTKM